MVPDMEGAVALELAKDSIRGAAEVVRGLKDIWNDLRHWQSVDEQDAMPHIQGFVHVHQSRKFSVPPLRDRYRVLNILSQPQLSPLPLDRLTYPSLGPVAILIEVIAQIHKRPTRLLNMLGTKLDRPCTLDQTSQDGQEVLLNIRLIGIITPSLNSRIQDILKDSMRRRPKSIPQSGRTVKD